MTNKYGSNLNTISKLKILLLNLTFLSVILISSVPYSKFVFYPVVSFSFLFSLLYIKFDLKRIFNAVKSLLPAIIQLLLFVFALSETKSPNLDLLKEGINVVTVILIGFILILSVDNINELKSYHLNIIRIIIYSSVIISILGLIKFFLELKGIELPIYYKNDYPFGSSLLPDYNFFSLINLAGIVFIIYDIFEEKISLGKYFRQFSLFCLSSNVLLAASRRANIILIIILSLLLLAVLFNMFSNSLFFVNQRFKLFRSLKFFFIVFLLFHSLILFSLIIIKPATKTSVSDFLGFKLSKSQYYTTSVFYKLESVFGAKNFTKTYSRLWHDSFDSRFPQSGWGNGDYALVNNLDSIGLPNLPVGAMAIKLDRYSNSYLSLMKSFNISFMTHRYLTRGKKYTFTMNCCVSRDFDGKLVSLIADLSDSPERFATYDTGKMQTWQKLTLNVFGDNNSADFYTSFYKDSVKNLSSLKGYVLFAYPTLDSITINPDEPMSWATNRFHEVFPLTGDSVEIVPSGCKGCLLDSSSYSQTQTIASGKYTYSYLIYGDYYLRTEEKALTSVYCYVDPAFNGSTVMLMTKSGQQNTHYNLSRKGMWQKLTLETNGSNDKLQTYLYFAKYAVPDFKSLKGYIIFAHPVIEVFHSDSLMKYHSSLNSVSSVVVQQASLFPFSALKLTFRGNIQNQSDFHLASGSSDFYQKYNGNNFAGPRLDHWRYAYYLFRKYNLKQRILGGGFNYMNQFGKEFNGDYEKISWPHNPLISILLYSGFVGFALYFWLLFRTLQIYWLYRKEYWPLLMCFLISFFFSFFSANNPFDPTITGFFVIFPFFIHSVYKKRYNALNGILYHLIRK
jgi:hypothetical protein